MITNEILGLTVVTLRFSEDIFKGACGIARHSQLQTLRLTNLHNSFSHFLTLSTKMFLSKFMLSALCLFALMSLSVASPTLAPEPRAELEVRQISNVLGIVKQLQGTAAPIMKSLSSYM